MLTITTYMQNKIRGCGAQEYKGMAESLDTTKVVKGYSPRVSIFPHFISSCNIEAHF